MMLTTQNLSSFFFFLRLKVFQKIYFFFLKPNSDPPILILHSLYITTLKPPLRPWKSPRGFGGLAPGNNKTRSMEAVSGGLDLAPKSASTTTPLIAAKLKRASYRRSTTPQPLMPFRCRKRCFRLCCHHWLTPRIWNFISVRRALISDLESLHPSSEEMVL